MAFNATDYGFKVMHIFTLTGTDRTNRSQTVYSMFNCLCIAVSSITKSNCRFLKLRILQEIERRRIGSVRVRPCSIQKTYQNSIFQKLPLLIHSFPFQS